MLKDDMKKNLSDIKISLIVFDFDGVMTDNRVYVDENGKEGVFVSRADGQGINLLQKAGYRMIILSTDKNPVVEVRGKKLGIDVIHGVDDKSIVLKKYCEMNQISTNEVLYIGNDVNDIAAMKLSGFSCVPKDAEPEAKENADMIIDKNGGYGVVRELARIILQAGGYDGQ